MLELPTKIQKEVFSYIAQYIQENGYAPILKEIQDKLGYESHSPIEEHIKKLVEKGYLTKRKSQPRGIQITQAGKDYLAEYAA